MIVLDTHRWIWWVEGDQRLTAKLRAVVEENEATGLGIPAICCREVAKAVEPGRLTLPVNLLDWLRLALDYPGIALLPLTPEIAAESTRLPQPIHRDPADQIILATARMLDLALISSDAKLLAYPHVRKVGG